MALAVFCFVGGLTGCTARLPQYPRVDAETALSIMSRRAQSVQTLSAKSRLTMSRPRGATVELDAVLVARPPDYSRVRAWKMSRAVLDITLNPDGLFVVSPADSAGPDDPLAALTADRWRQAMLLLVQRMDPLEWTPDSTLEDRPLIIRKSIPPGEAVCEVHRRTLTLRECRLSDSRGQPVLTIVLDRHACFGDAVFPRLVTFRSPQGDIRIRLDSIEVNADHPDTAFIPPRRAIRRP